MSKEPRKSSVVSPDQQGPSFEDNLQKLDAIVSELEQGTLPLDKALKLYEEGIEAYRACHAMLKQADMKVAKLVETISGDLKEEPFEPSKEAEEK